MLLVRQLQKRLADAAVLRLLTENPDCLSECAEAFTGNQASHSLRRTSRMLYEFQWLCDPLMDSVAVKRT